MLRFCMILFRKKRMVVASPIHVIYIRICANQRQTIQKSEMNQLHHYWRLIILLQNQSHIILYRVVIVLTDIIFTSYVWCAGGAQFVSCSSDKTHPSIPQVLFRRGRVKFVNRNIDFQPNICRQRQVLFRRWRVKFVNRNMTFQPNISISVDSAKSYYAMIL